MLRQNPRRLPLVGMTLVELLVVLVIVGILLTVMVPFARSISEDRKLREASRMINGYFAAAQARAFERGRPVWVGFNRSVNQPHASIKLEMGETPPPYIGDVVDARAYVSGWDVIFGTNHVGDLTKLVIKGDTIRFNFQGHYFLITNVSSAGLTIANLPSNPSTTVPAPTHPQGVTVPNAAYGAAFQILRAPRVTTVSPLTLPPGSCVDLTLSGHGSDSNACFNPTAGTDPVLVSFLPTGGLGELIVNGVRSRLKAPVHFLVGRIDRVERIDASPRGTEINARDGNCLWVSANHTTGVVTTTELNPLPVVSGTEIAHLRKFAISAQSMGGR